MGQLTILRQRDYQRQVWRNGGGTTFQIAISPAGSALADFDWRLSIAEIAGDCSFSVFDGYDRTLVLLEGSDLLLKDAEGREIRLDPAQPMVSFRGETAFDCLLPGGPTRDFNVMTRRDILRHRVDVFPCSPVQQHVGIASDLIFVFCLGRSLKGESEGRSFHLEQYDMAKIEGRAGGRIDVHGPRDAGFLCVAIFR